MTGPQRLVVAVLTAVALFVTVGLAIAATPQTVPPESSPFCGEDIAPCTGVGG